MIGIFFFMHVSHRHLFVILGSLFPLWLAVFEVPSSRNIVTNQKRGMRISQLNVQARWNICDFVLTGRLCTKLIFTLYHFAIIKQFVHPRIIGRTKSFCTYLHKLVLSNPLVGLCKC